MWSSKIVTVKMFKRMLQGKLTVNETLNRVKRCVEVAAEQERNL